MFPNYESAKDFVRETGEGLDTVKIPVEELEQIENYDGYTYSELREPESWEPYAYSAGYVDRRGISIQTSAVKRIEEGGKEVGVVTIFFIENVSGGGAVKNNSQYFEFDFEEEKSK